MPCSCGTRPPASYAQFSTARKPAPYPILGSYPPMPPRSAMNESPAPTENRFDWADPLPLDESLSEDERMVRDSAHAYCQEKLFSRILEANRHEHFDHEIMNEMGALGFLGST